MSCTRPLRASSLSVSTHCNRKDEARKGRVQLIDGREMFTKLRKGLGSKRNELSPQNIETVVGLYAGFEDGEHSKIFRNEDFLYRTITVERPLKLNWQATPERIDTVFEAKAVQKLSETDASALRAALDRLGTDTVWKNRAEFQKVLKDAARAEGLTLPGPLLKTVTTELGEQDDTADTCTDAKGNPEPDASLRDTENVPWDEDVDVYVGREVLPYDPTPGSTTRRPRKARRSPSPATSTSTSRDAPSKRSTVTSKPSWNNSAQCSSRLNGDDWTASEALGEGGRGSVPAVARCGAVRWQGHAVSSRQCRVRQLVPNGRPPLRLRATNRRFGCSTRLRFAPLSAPSIPRISGMGSGEVSPPSARERFTHATPTGSCSIQRVGSTPLQQGRRSPLSAAAISATCQSP